MLTIALTRESHIHRCVHREGKTHTTFPGKEKHNTFSEKEPLLKKKGSDFLPNIFGRNFWNLRLLECWDSSYEVPLVPPAYLRLLDELVTKVQAEEDDNVDV